MIYNNEISKPVEIVMQNQYQNLFFCTMMEKEIGENVSISKLKNETVVKITSRLEKWQEISLLVWIVLWTVMGIYVVYYLTTVNVPEDQQIFFIIYMAFWFYFEFHAVRAYLFKMFGYELIKFTKYKLLYKRSLFGLGRSKHYSLKNIEGFRLAEHSRKSFAGAYAKSFWTLANERIEFDYLNGKGTLGMHLEDRDAQELYRFLNQELKRSR